VVVVRPKWRAGNQCGNVPNAERRKRAILGKGAKREIPWCAALPKAVALVVPRTSRAIEVCVSRGDILECYLIRLINVSGLCSN